MKAGGNEPPITVKDYRQNRKCHVVEIIHDAVGAVVARAVRNAQKALSCGARVWIETTHNVTVNG